MNELYWNVSDSIGDGVDDGRRYRRAVRTSANAVVPSQGARYPSQIDVVPEPL